RGAAPRHVDLGAGSARHGSHHHPDHALHRGSRGNGGPNRRHQQGRPGRGRRKGPTDEEARQEAADLAPAGAASSASGRTGIMGPRDQSRRSRSGVHRRWREQHRYFRAAETDERAVDRGQGPANASKLARGYFRQAGERACMNPPRIRFNRHGVWAIYKFEIARSLRTLVQSLVPPVPTTSLYFVVFGAAIGSRLSTPGGVSYGAFIVPGLIMLALFTESLSNASFGIYFPKFTGTIYELLSAPVSYAEIVIAYVGAAASKSVVLGLIILATASLFVPIRILHPAWMIAFLLMTAFTFSLFGFIIGIWAKGFEQLQFIPMLIITPLTFLGGAFYSIDMLPPAWRTFSLFNP